MYRVVTWGQEIIEGRVGEYHLQKQKDNRSLFFFRKQTAKICLCLQSGNGAYVWLQYGTKKVNQRA